jgi:2-keto-4-pentenoate hydratase
MDIFDVATALESYQRHRSEGTFFPPEWEETLSIEEAYTLQLAILDRHIEIGSRQIGWKVGLTAKPIQEQFNVHEPGFGFLLDDAPHASGDAIDFATLTAPGIENELCMTMGTTLAGPGVTFDDAVAAIASVAPAFELIETRGDSRGSLAKGIPDNLQQNGIVLGTSVPIASLGDLADVRVRLDINDLPADEGTSAAVLGNPVNSVVWLANKLSEFGRSIAAGEIVMTGSFIRQFRVAQGDAFHADFDGVGVVEVRFP